MRRLLGAAVWFWLWGVGFSVTSASSTLVVAGDFQQRIPAAGTGPAAMSPVTFFVPADNHRIADLDVLLDVRHTEVSDLVIDLQSPAGTLVTLKGFELMDSLWPGIHRPNLTDTVFDDEAHLFLTDGAPPYTGRFRPTQPLSAFDGQPAAGFWTLYIQDIAAGDTGTLDRWELHFTIAAAPEPSTLALAALAAALACRRRRPSFPSGYPV